MRMYCKAYQVRELRQFSGWTARAKDGHELADDDICYLWDDFTVVENPVQESGVLFDQVTPEWQDFCRTLLKFEIPEDVRSLEELSKQESTS